MFLLRRSSYYMATEKQIIANRENCKKSRGPKTPSGMNRSKLNALKLGIFSRSALLPGEDPKDLARLHRDLIVQHRPIGPGEFRLVDEIAAVTCRLLRATKIESGLFHLYRFDEASKKMGNEAQAFANDQKQLATITKLPMVEGYLDRKLDRLMKRLKDLQSSR